MLGRRVGVGDGPRRDVVAGRRRSRVRLSSGRRVASGMGSAVLGLEDNAVRFVAGTALLLLLVLKLLVLGLVMLLAVLRVLVVLMVASKGAQAGQARRVGLRSWGERRLLVRILGMLGGGAVAVHQSVGLGDLVRSIELLRGKGRRSMVSGHGVDGRTHGLAVVVAVRDGGGTPALGRRLCDGGRIASFRHAGSASALARAWLGLLGLRRASGST